MIEWTAEEKGSETVFSPVGETVVGADELHAALVDLWDKVLHELAVRDETLDWDILIVALVTQCGELVVLPATQSDEEPDAPPFSVWLQIDAWATAYNDLPDSEDGDDGELLFEAAYQRLHDDQCSALKNAILDKQVAGAFRAFKKRRKFGIYCVDEPEGYIRDRLEFLWGNRPQRRAFKSSKELFEHVFRKAVLSPDYSMRLENGAVTAVHWPGHEFNDSYVAILEDVPNLPELCAGLKEFLLTATRVSESGLQRLKALLPGVVFTITSDEDHIENDIDPYYEREMWDPYKPL